MTTNIADRIIVQSTNIINRALYGINNRRRLWFYIYTLTFLITFAICFSPFLLQGRGFVWYLDGRMQTYPWLAYVGQRVRTALAGFLKGDFTVPLYDLSMGWGDDIIGFMGSYAQLDPVAVLLSALVPVLFTEALYSFIIVLRLYLAGLAFIFMCRHFCKRPFESYIGSILYLFSAYAIYTSTAYPYFLIFMILFPLLIVGADRIEKRERAGLFIFCVFYMAVCSYYFLFMSTVMVGIFALLRFFDLYEKGNRKAYFMPLLCRGIGLYLLGLGLAAPILIPGVFELLQSGRSSYNHAAISSDIYVHWRYFWERLLTLIAPKREYDLEWGLDFPCFAAIALPAIIIQFSKKQNSALKWLLSMALLCLFSSFGGLMMNGFQYPSNRWAFGLSLVVAYSVTDSLPALFQAKEREKRICLITLFIYAIIAIIVSMGGATISFPLLGVGFLAVTTVFIIAASDNPTLNRTHRLKKALCVVLIVLNVGINSIYMFSSDLMGWVNRFGPIGNETLLLAGSMEANASKMPYRAGMQDGRINSNALQYNYSMVYDVPGTNIYTTTLNGNVTRFWNELECNGNLQEFRIYSTGQQTMLDALLSVKHQMKWADSADHIPYGYNEIGIFMGAAVYENQYALPWGYTYADTISVESLKGLNGIQKQEILLQAVALDEGKGSAASFPLSSKSIPYTADFSDCLWEDGRLYVSSPAAAIILHADLEEGKEYYLRIVGLDIGGYGDQFVSVSATACIDFSVKCGDVSASGRAMAKEYPWYYGRENYLFCLGYSDLKRDTIAIQFPKEGLFSLDTIELIELPMDSYIEHVEKLRAEALEDIVVASNRITGTVDLSADKILCLSIPYGQGWTATIDGEPVPIMKANYAFMGIQVPKGPHMIEFRYFTPGLAAGLCICLFCIIGLFTFLILTKIIRKGKKPLQKDSGQNSGKSISPLDDNSQRDIGSLVKGSSITGKIAVTARDSVLFEIITFCRKHYIDVVVLQILFVIVCLQKELITYETNDDFYMSMLLHGAWGQATDHLVFINILLGRLLRMLVSIVPSIGWYYYLQVACCLAAFICAGIVIKHRNNLIYWISLPAILWLVERECYQSMQFTKTAGVLAAAGTLLIINSFECREGSIFGRITGCLLIFVSSLFRLDSTAIACGVFSVLALGQVVKKHRINIKMCMVWVGTFGLCLAAMAYNAHVYQSEPEWARYAEFNKKRSLINDWNISDWNDYFTAYSDEYQQANIDPNDLLMMRYWSFTDPDVYDTEFLDTAVTLKLKTMADYRHSSKHLRAYSSAMFNIIRSEGLFILLPVLLLIWFFSGKKRQLCIIGIPLMFLALTFYCYHIDRYWNHRALFTLLCSATFLLIYLIALSDTWEVSTLIRSLPMLLAIAMMGVIWIQGTLEPAPDNESFQYTLRKINEQENALYMVEPLDYWLLESVDTREPLQEGSCRNLCDTGGWMVNSPIVAGIFQKHSVVNPWAECIDNDNIYFIDKVRMANKTSYIRKHYSPGAGAQLVRLSSDAHIFSIRSKKLIDEDSVHNEDTHDIEYRVECVPEGDRLTINGNICKGKHSTFDQSVFFRISHEGMTDVVCDAVLMEDVTYLPEDDRHFSGFIGQIEIHDLLGDELKVYLCLKANAVYKIDITSDVALALESQVS